MPKFNLEDYDRQVADKMIELIRSGTAPWQKPWDAGEHYMPRNLQGRPYRGGNMVWLSGVREMNGYGDHRWGTYRAIQNEGGQVKRGEKATRILWWQWEKKVRVGTTPDGKPVYELEKLDVPWVRAFSVFNADQAKDLPAAEPAKPHEWTGCNRAESIVEATGIEIVEQGGDRACYDIETDKVRVPLRSQFTGKRPFYHTLFHEVAHASGHPDRLDRETLKKGIEEGFGSPTYAREELRAELASFMTGELLGLGFTPQHPAAYVEGWIKLLEDDPKEIRTASSEAQKISSWILSHEEEEDGKVH